ncbi:PIR protein [Plasmodium sp. DRC-Itaito]|nr:PIR protein [Plasmodium sp. DRC-Itaito]
MKVHNFNILLFALPLNILINDQRNHYITTYTHINRSLCECELYMPNYDNDPHMKEVMENFNKQTQQRFHEYDDRMIQKRKQCKDKCDKEIQKIILKDKLEKQMAEQFATLDTDIQSDAIPTCICEKSIADKVEKGCLKCGGVLGGGVAPSVGLLGGLGTYAWKVAALKVAFAAARKAGIAKGLAEGNALGMKIVIKGLNTLKVDISKSVIFNSLVKTRPYNSVYNLQSIINEQYRNLRWLDSSVRLGEEIERKVLGQALEKATETATAKAVEVRSATTAAITKEKTSEIAATYIGNQTAIIASVVAIVVIVLIMVIIYLILRHRRKKKMKKKLQYIKLLEE